MTTTASCRGGCSTVRPLPDDAYRRRLRGTVLDMTTTHETPAALLERSRTIAVVGFSANPSKAAHTAPMLLVRRGWHVIPVNPMVDEVAGLTAYATLADVPVPIDMVNVFRPAAEAPDIARQAVAVGAKGFWLQLDLRSDEARRVATEAGLWYVEDHCAGALAAHAQLSPPAPD
ncbi:MAG: CoA-binding domain protein [Thermoleophilia bacterium]|nr:CoA-binding domain protein [Thermoleophilia bacterium]